MNEDTGHAYTDGYNDGYSDGKKELKNELAALHQDASSKWAFLEWRDRAEKAEAENGALREQLTAIFGTAWEPAAPYPEIASCIAEIRGDKPTTIRLDAERLNWLEAFHDCCDMTGYRYKGMGIELVVRGSDGWHFASDFKPEDLADYDTLREIIDVAMKEVGK